MDDEMMQAVEVRDPELERRLEAFARLRLGPDRQAVARIRARLMREARLQHEAVRIAAYVVPAVDARRRSPARRAAMPLLAAAVWTVVAVGTIAAAQPGGGLYPARLWVERAALPSAAGARVDADLRHLDDRISEALGAASVGDRAALTAALEAYGLSAEDATTASASDAGLGARVEDALARHQAVLTALVAGLTSNGSDTALAAIERNLQRAIEHNAAVLATLETRRGGDPTTRGANAGNASGGGAGGATNGNGGGGPAAAGGPVGGTSGSTQGSGSGPTGGNSTGTDGSDAGATGGGGAGGGAEAGASQPPAGQDGGGGNGGGGNDGGGSGSRPSGAPAASPVPPDHSPRPGG